MIFVGDDWSETHHDVWVMDAGGDELASRRFREGLAGVGEFHALVAGYVADPAEVVVGTETDRGLWVEALVAAGYVVYAINPRSVSRYRDRHNVGGAKSDTADAKLLADLVRTDRHNHRTVAGDSPGSEATKVLARAHQSLIWERSRHVSRLRAALRQYYPAALDTFSELAHPDALAVLAKAPTPRKGAALTLVQIRSVLSKGGRQRYLGQRAEEIQQALGAAALEAPPEITDAYASSVAATVAIITELNSQISRLEKNSGDRFEQHPDAAIYLSLPGAGRVLGARMLGEFGDDPNRYADVKSRRNYAATSPITIASGKKKAVAARWVRNDRLYDAVVRWAFCSLQTSPGARDFYDQHRANGDSHYQALRTLGNRLVGILHGCLKHHTLYDEDTAWAHRRPATTKAA